MSFELPFVFVDEKAKGGDKAAQEELTPKRASALAAGYDLVAANLDPIVLAKGKRVLVPTGIAIALPEGFEAQIRSRSGLAVKNGVTVLNSPGTIDADYRGEIKAVLVNHGEEDFLITRGMRVAQMVIARVEAPNLVACASLPDSARGSGGFGSTGG
jgi:dUTP pyrophosphatase